MEDDDCYSSLPVGITALLGLATALALLRLLSQRKLDPREPPVISSTLPFMGHLIGILWYGAKYFKHLASQSSYPIFTLPTLTSRMYVVVDPGLAASVQRASKALSFNPIIPEVTQRVLGLDDETKAIVATNIDRDGLVRGFYPNVQDLIYSTLTPGVMLDELNMRAYTEFLQMMNDYCGGLQRRETSRLKEENLMFWIQHLVSVSTARFLYGPGNPISMNPELEAAFWDFVHGIPRLLLSVFPSITARAAYKGREALVSAFVEYLQFGREKLGSRVTQARINVGRQHGFTLSNLARSEISFLFAGIINTTFTSFWMVLHIFARPQLLQEVRSELEQSVLTDTNEVLPPSRPWPIRIGKITKSSPILLATFRETLRLHSEVLSSRIVTADNFLLQDKYFLRKGSLVQISGGAMHADPKIWGDHSTTFKPARFLNAPSPQSEADSSGKPRSFHPAAFRAFGGGATLCPGRHFAQSEILGLTAMIVLRFDVEPLVPGKAIEIPAKRDDVLPIHIFEPKDEVRVKIGLRKGWEEVNWQIVHN